MWQMALMDVSLMNDFDAMSALKQQFQCMFCALSHFCGFDTNSISCAHIRSLNQVPKRNEEFDQSANLK